MKYIDAEKLKNEIETRIALLKGINGDSDYGKGSIDADMGILEYIDSLQQEQSEGIQGTVHHYGGIVHYVVTNQEQLNARLIQFPNDAEVEMFIEARKEDTK